MAYIYSRINALTREYPLLPLLSALIAGILLQQRLPGLTVPVWLLPALLSFAFSLWLHPKFAANRNTAMIKVLLIGLSSFFTGALISSLQDIRLQRDWYGHYLKTSGCLAVKITGVPQLRAKTLYLPAQVIHTKQGTRWIDTRGDIKLYLYRKDSMPAFAAGETLLIPAKLLPLQASGNPFAFDYAAYAARNGIFHQAFLSPDEVRIIASDTSASLLTRWQRTLAESINCNIPDSTTRSLLLATLLNERAGIEETLWKAYAATGIVHIIAISGMHIMLLAGLLLFVLKLLPWKQLDVLKYLLALCCVWLYIALTGFPPSAVRAGLMFSIAAFGLMIRRKGNAINTWAASGLLLLCYNPYWLYDIGVQLSFLAVLSIILFYRPVRGWYRPGNILAAVVWDMFALSLAAQVLVSPLLIYYFHQFPLLGLIANVPATLYSTALLYGALGILCFHFTGWSWLSLWLGKCLILLTQYFHMIILRLEAYTPAMARQLYIDGYECWLLLSLAIFSSLLFMRKKERYIWPALAAALLLIADLIIKDIAASRQERIVVYNTSRSRLADIFRGKTVTPVYSGDTLDSGRDEQYVLLPSRLGFRALRQAPAHPAAGLYRIGKARILFLDDCGAITGRQSFSVDFLVISNGSAFLPKVWYTLFHPRKIIIDGSVPRRKARQWQQQLLAYGASVHWVREDGAWTYPE